MEETAVTSLIVHSPFKSKELVKRVFSEEETVRKLKKPVYLLM